MAVRVTDFEVRVLRALQELGPCGPSILASVIWNDHHGHRNRIAPMSAALTKLRKRSLVNFAGVDGGWSLALGGLTVLLQRRDQQWKDAFHAG